MHLEHFQVRQKDGGLNATICFFYTNKLLLHGFCIFTEQGQHNYLFGV